MDVVFDLCCGCGGASVGYYRAGYVPVGFDIVDQPNYSFEFYRLDVVTLDYEKLLDGPALIHASPPCQGYSKANRSHSLRYMDLYQPIKALLVASGKPYVIENVPGSPLRRSICLCGTQFDLKVKRHRLFESNLDLIQPEKRCQCSRHVIGAGGYVTAAGNMCTKIQAQQAMDIDWRVSKREVMQAVPPAYTEFIGSQIRDRNLLAAF